MSVRVETIGSATLYCGDCREILPTLSVVDAVITDPPYGLGDRMSGGTWGAAEKYAGMREWDQKAPQELVAELIALAPRVVVWGGNYFTLPPSRRWLIWDKQNAVPTMADCEMAWCSFDGNTKRIRLPVGAHSHGHPTEKPLRLMEWCIEQIGEARVILDPFMGSGTTGAACMNLGRKFIGIEIEPKYFEIACERLDQAERQGRMFA